jgi:hypothetical protein
MLYGFNDRIRDVVQGPDGYVYLLTDEDDGRILRLEPARPPSPWAATPAAVWFCRESVQDKSRRPES